MWIREAIVAPPPGSRLALVLTWMRTALLCLVAVSLGKMLDAALVPPGTHAILIWACMGSGCAVVAAGASAWAQARVGLMTRATETQWRARVMRAAMASDPIAADAEVLDAATDGVEKVAAYRAGFLTPTLASFTSPLIVLAAWATALDPVSAAILLVAVALVPPFIISGDKVLRRSNSEFRRRKTEANSRYVEMVEGLGTISVLAAGERVLAEFARSARGTMAELTRLLARNQIVIVVHDVIFGVLMGCVAAALVLHGFSTGAWTLGQALTGVMLIVLLKEPMAKIGRTFYVALGGQARRTQIEELTAASHPAGAAGANARAGGANARATGAIRGAAKPADAPAISLRGIGVDRGERTTLHDVSLDIPAGARLVLVGPSGAGKTTLLRILSGLEEPTRGQILLNGIPADAATRRATSATLGQHVDLLSTTIAENLRLVSPNATDGDLLACLADAGMSSDLGTMPDGPGTVVGEAGALLSGGQRRRVGLARMLLHDRPLVVLDEPTADLDRATERFVRGRLTEVLRGRTVVETSHRLGAVTDADLIAVIEEGRLVDVGTPTELRARDGYYAHALAAESREVVPQ